MKNINKNRLIDSFKNTIFEPLKKPLSEYAELGIDSVMDSDVLKQIPVISTIIGFCKLGYNLHERHMINEIMKFFDGLDVDSIDKERLRVYREYLEDNPIEMEKELSRILIMLDKNIEDRQSKYLGKFYRALLNQEIKNNEFVIFSRIVVEMFDSDFDIIRNFEEITCDKKNEYQRLCYLNLISEKPVISNGEIEAFDEGYGLTAYQQAQFDCGYCYKMTELGVKFLRLID